MNPSKMTFKEILQVFIDGGFSVEDFAYGDINWPDDFIFPEPLNTQYQEYLTWRNIPYKERESQIAPKFDWNEAKNYWLDSIGVGPMIEVDRHGGEGEGDNWYSVKHFPKHDVYICVSGYYQSHHGTEFYDGWDCCREVNPVQKTITVYE